MFNTKWFPVFITFCVSILFFIGVLVLSPNLYDILSLEDGIVEYLTAVGLLITSVFLLYGSWLMVRLKGNKIAFVLLGVAGLVFLMGAGEEISWGQRIFDIDTPEALLEINEQDEFNLHNVDKKFFDRLVDRGAILFVLVTSILLLVRKSKLFEISIPNFFIILAFALTPFYHQYNSVQFEFHHLIYLAILVLSFTAYKERRMDYAIAILLTIGITILLPYIHTVYNHHFQSHNNSANEYREFLFSICCMLYAFYIMSKIKEYDKQ